MSAQRCVEDGASAAVPGRIVCRTKRAVLFHKEEYDDWVHSLFVKSRNEYKSRFILKVVTYDKLYAHGNEHVGKRPKGQANDNGGHGRDLTRIKSLVTTHACAQARRNLHR